MDNTLCSYSNNNDLIWLFQDELSTLVMQEKNCEYNATYYKYMYTNKIHKNRKWCKWKQFLKIKFKVYPFNIVERSSDFFKIKYKKILITNRLTIKKLKFLTIFEKKIWVYMYIIMNNICLTKLYDVDIPTLWQGLNFRTEWQDSSPKFRNPIEKNHESKRLLHWKILVFSKIFAFMKRNSLFPKNLLVFM